jgi:hypothetical protein
VAWFLAVGALAAALLAGAGRAAAQSSPPAPKTATGIAADRFVPAIGPSAFGQVEGAPVAPAGQLWLTGYASALGQPLRLRDALTGVEVAEPVRYRVNMDLGAELGVFRKRLALGIGMPIALWQIGDRLAATGASDPMAQAGNALATTAIGDLRLRFKALLSPLEKIAAAALVVELTAPGPGDGAANFVATSGFTLAPRLIGWLHKGPIAAAVNVELRLAPARTLYQTTLHDSFFWGAALAGELPARRVGLALLAEATGELNLVPGQYLYSTELRGLLRITWWRAALDIGGGGGLGPMAPAWRGFIGFRGWLGTRDRSQVGCPVRPTNFL